MSAGADKVLGSLDFEESAADVAPSGIIRVRRHGGVLQVSVDGLTYSPLAGGGWIETVVPGDVQDVTVASGFNPAEFNGFEFEGYFAAVAGAEAYSLRPDNTDTNCASINISGTGAVVASGSQASFFLTDADAAGRTPSFRASLRKSGASPRHFECIGYRGQPASGDIHITIGQHAAAAALPTSFVIHGSTADAIKAGSILRWRGV